MALTFTVAGISKIGGEYRFHVGEESETRTQHLRRMGNTDIEFYPIEPTQNRQLALKQLIASGNITSPEALEFLESRVHKPRPRIRTLTPQDIVQAIKQSQEVAV